MSEISYEALRKVQLQERNFGALSSLDEEFYERYNLWLAEQKRLLQSEFRIETLKAYENAKKIIEEISEKREQKIVLKALKDLRSNSIDSSGLSKEEKTFYLKLLATAKDFEETVVQFKEKKPELKAEERKEMAKLGEKLLSIRMLVSISKFVAPDGNTYGPFEPAQIVSMEKEVAELLVKKGAAKHTGSPEDEEPEMAAERKEVPDTIIMN